MAPVQNWILGVSTGPSVKPSTEPAGIRISTLRFPFPRSHSLEIPSTKGCGKKSWFPNVNIDVWARDRLFHLGETRASRPLKAPLPIPLNPSSQALFGESSDVIALEAVWMIWTTVAAALFLLHNTYLHKSSQDFPFSSAKQCMPKYGGRRVKIRFGGWQIGGRCAPRSGSSISGTTNMKSETTAENFSTQNITTIQQTL